MTTDQYHALELDNDLKRQLREDYLKLGDALIGLQETCAADPALKSLQRQLATMHEAFLALLALD
ncbi:MAG: hypothetical protein RhofKO_25760 [Rhodothermales bacterium]